MSGMSPPAGWGPSHQTTTRQWKQRPAVQLTAFVAVFALSSALGGFVIALVVVIAAILAAQAVINIANAGPRGAAPAIKAGDDPLEAVRGCARAAGGGVYLGLADNRGWRHARAERAVLLLGPPRSGKTSAVIIPAVISHAGPVVCTSTKPDVAALTWRARQRSGRLWVFDPTGSGESTGFEQLRWSPIRASVAWDGALLMARAMTTGANVGHGTTHGSHWAKRSQALLAPLLHAAALEGRDMETVVGWVMGHELNEAGVILEQERASRLAFGSLLGVFNTEERERASIFSAAADALEAYTSESALEAAKDPNFDPAGFVASGDTIYIQAPAEAQALAAPLVCGLLAEVRRETYLAHRRGRLTSGRVLFALDEAANIAPLEELPAIASEGGGQGLTLLAAFQDLSQARKRWGEAAEGFLTLFGTKLIVPGIADPRTLDSVSTALGEYNRQMLSTTRGAGASFAGALAGMVAGPGGSAPQRSTTVSAQRTRILSPGEIANIPAGRALHLDGLRWQLLTVTPAHSAEPWKTLIAPPATE
jgi:type IV secretion system protein VirD4